MQFDLKGSKFSRQSLSNDSYHQSISENDGHLIPKRLSKAIKRSGETLKDCDFRKL